MSARRLPFLCWLGIHSVETQGDWPMQCGRCRRCRKRFW